MNELVATLRRQCVEMDCGNCNTCVKRQAADAIEELVRKEKFHAFLWNTIQPNEMEAYISMYNAGNEKVETK